MYKDVQTYLEDLANVCISNTPYLGFCRQWVCAGSALVWDSTAYFWIVRHVLFGSDAYLLEYKTLFYGIFLCQQNLKHHFSHAHK